MAPNPRSRAGLRPDWPLQGCDRAEGSRGRPRKASWRGRLGLGGHARVPRWSSSMTAPAPVITFLSDYGLHDDFVGVCHGVMARLCPEARVIDLTHGVARHDVRGGALVLD